jgi:hypothetical protein
MQEQNQYPLADSKEIETDPGFVDLAALAAGGDFPVVDSPSLPSEPSAAEGSVVYSQFLPLPKS